MSRREIGCCARSMICGSNCYLRFIRAGDLARGLPLQKLARRGRFFIDAYSIARLAGADCSCGSEAGAPDSLSGVTDAIVSSDAYRTWNRVSLFS